MLNALADALLKAIPPILAANAQDLAKMPQEDPRYDRLLLNPERLAGIARDLRQVAQLPSPLGHVLFETTRPNGLHIQKISVPLGVVGVIYESRPNVTVDVFALCFKSGNRCVLKGGKEATHSNQALADVIQATLMQQGFDSNLLTLLPPTRESTDWLLNAVDQIDVCIPRGSQHLINYVREHARVPVIETGAGIVHTYFDEAGDLNLGKAVIFNAKTRRVSVCNALDTLLVHQSRLSDLAELIAPIAQHAVEIFADNAAYAQLENHYPTNLLQMAKPEDFGREFLSYKMSIKTVASLQEALGHIAQYSSKHSEAIITANANTAEDFLARVDAAAVYVNTSTAFTDGAEFGLGAEIGISTQKLHARGPMGLEALTSYKWVVHGTGQIRA